MACFLKDTLGLVPLQRSTSGQHHLWGEVSAYEVCGTWTTAVPHQQPWSSRSRHHWLLSDALVLSFGG